MRTHAEYGRLSEVERDHRLRGCAIDLAAQLPSDKQDALLVLEYARNLVVDFLPGRVKSAGPAVSRMKPVA